MSRASQEITQMWAKLEAPFAWEEIAIKVQSTNQDKTKALPVAYLDSRCVRKRLNDVFGPHMWTASHREVYEESGGNKRIVGVVCKITATLPDGTAVEREEVGIPSAIEPIKGAYSDALKRCFAAFGNDHLYHIHLGWYPYDKLKSFKPFADSVLVQIKAQYERQIKNLRTETLVEMPEEFHQETADAAPAATRADRIADKLGVAPSEEGDGIFSERWR